MNRFYYDLHIHSCLSPCADNDCTPGNIAGMGQINRLNLMALTDHNTCMNCPAFFEAAESMGITPVAGMELTTSEDIHAVCLFANLEDAMSFSRAVDGRRIKVENRVDIFGDQLILNSDDMLIGTEPYLLSNATTVSIDEVAAFAQSYGGVAYPAHIDRESNGAISVLGSFPHEAGFTAAEIHRSELSEQYTDRYGLGGKQLVFSSDAHYLWDISETVNSIELDAEFGDHDRIRRALIDALRSRL